MDRSQPQEREIVFCHECENEWYRDEHGIVCPECTSDFTEIIEADHDPRDDHDHVPTDGETLGDHQPWPAPDPDEDDIEHFEWRGNTGDQPVGGRLHGTIRRQFTIGGDPQQAFQQREGGFGGGLMGLIGNALQGALGASAQSRQYQQPQSHYQHDQHDARGQSDQGPRSPSSGQEPPPSGSPFGNTFVHAGSGPGYAWTVTTSTNARIYPRDANSAQAPNQQPEFIDQILQQMFSNIGAVQGGGLGQGRPGGPPRGFMFMGPGGDAGDGRGPPQGLDDIMQMFGMGRGGVHGDAVYSQEALDRIITQLMEQHQSGNAPGPASADAIRSLPTKKITDADFGDNGKAECSICMDEAEVGSSVTILPCNHWFHFDCINAWLSEHDTCPHCRQGIMARDQPGNNRPRQPDQAPLHDTHSPAYHSPRTPGEYPFPPSAHTPGLSRSDEGRNRYPWSNPGSPAPASPSARPDSNSGRRPASNMGLFNIMRESFGRGNGSNANPPSPRNNNNN